MKSSIIITKVVPFIFEGLKKKKGKKKSFSLGEVGLISKLKNITWTGEENP